MPPARTAWTSERGASDIAATWNAQAPAAIAIPIANSLEANSPRAERMGLAHVDGRRGTRAPVLEQEAEVRGQSAAEREQDAEEWSHQREGGGAGPELPGDPGQLTYVLGSPAAELERGPARGTPYVRRRDRVDHRDRPEIRVTYVRFRCCWSTSTASISLFGFDPATPPPGRWMNVEGVLHLHLGRPPGRRSGRWPANSSSCGAPAGRRRPRPTCPDALGLPGATVHLSFERNPGRANAHWKLAAIEAYAGPERPVAWVDDALDERCHAWAAARAGADAAGGDRAGGGPDRDARRRRCSRWARALRRAA